MKYSKISTINNVSTYFLKDNFLFFDSGKQLQEHILFMNNELIGLKGLSDYFFIKDTILFNKWGEKGSFSYNINTREATQIEENQQITALKDNILIYADENDIYYYKDLSFKNLFSSSYFFNIIAEDCGFSYDTDKVLKLNFQDKILWQFTIASLGDSPYPDEEDRIDKIVGIANGNLWVYTNLYRLIALDIETGSIQYHTDCFGVQLDEVTKNIFSIASNGWTVIDTQTLTVKESYFFSEEDPNMGQYKSIFDPLLQGDYFTFVGSKPKEHWGIGWIGIFDYKARKLVWEHELISEEERKNTRNHLAAT
nr:hypothetical protein [uncultured Capnocytophaga sp.]